MQVPNWSREKLQDILSDALSEAWTPAQEAILNSEAGMETVIDAVERVTARVLLLPAAVHAAPPHPCMCSNMHLYNYACFLSMHSCRHACILPICHTPLPQ